MILRPPISALLPIYNGEPWIENALQSINKTLRTTDELLVVDDGSSDATVKILESASIVPKMKLVKSMHLGLVSALNLGMQKATNEWIARYDVDDRYESNRIEILLDNVQSNTVAVFSDYIFMGKSGEYLGRMNSPIFSGAVKLSLFHSQRTAHPSVIYRKSAVIMVGGYLEEDFPCEDLSLWFRLSEIGNFESRASTLLTYTLSENTITSKNRKDIRVKARSVVERYGSDRQITDAATNLAKTLADYDNYSFSNARRFLHLTDFLHNKCWELLNYKQKLRIIQFLVLELLNRKTWNSIFNLFFEKRKRIRYRKGFTNHKHG